MSNVRIEGLQGVIKEISTLANEKVRSREVQKIMRKQMGPINRAVKQNTPEANHPVTIKGVTYNPRNLRKSIKIFNGKNKSFPSVYVGPAMGSNKKNDGFYAFFEVYGTVYKEPNDFIGDAALPILPNVNRVMSKDLKRYIDRQAKKLKL